MPRGRTRDRDGIYTRKDRPGFWASWIDARGKRRQRKLTAHTLQQARTLLNAEKARVEKTVTMGYAPPSTETFSVVSAAIFKTSEGTSDLALLHAGRRHHQVASRGILRTIETRRSAPGRCTAIHHTSQRRGVAGVHRQRAERPEAPARARGRMGTDSGEPCAWGQTPACPGG